MYLDGGRNSKIRVASTNSGVVEVDNMFVYGRIDDIFLKYRDIKLIHECGSLRGAENYAMRQAERRGSHAVKLNREGKLV